MRRSVPSAKWPLTRNTQIREAIDEVLVSDMYANIDAMRLNEFAEVLAPDVKVVVGNNPAMNGRQAAKEGIGYFFSTIKGLKHHLVNVVEGNGLTFLEANVEYLRKDGKTVTVPVVTVLERSSDLVTSLRIYFDVAPVYA
jgi:ketosteroid isomerase-like protein